MDADWDDDCTVEDRMENYFYTRDVESCCSVLDVGYSGEKLDPDDVDAFTAYVISALERDYDGRKTAIFYEVANLKELIPEMEKHGWIATQPQLRSRHGPYPVQQFVYMTKKPKGMK